MPFGDGRLLVVLNNLYLASRPNLAVFDKELDMHSRFFSTLAALVLFAAAVYGQRAARDPNCPKLLGAGSARTLAASLV